MRIIVCRISYNKYTYHTNEDVKMVFQLLGIEMFVICEKKECKSSI